jgi:simple sugar transport system permease protein
MKKEASIAVIIIILSIVLSFINPVFLTIDNILDILKGNVVLGILAMGMTLVIITGGIDVSVAAVTTAVCVVIGKLLVMVPDHIGALFLLLVIACLLGIILGGINGFLVSKIEIPAIVVTLGAMSMINGIVLYVTNGQYLNSTDFPKVFLKFSNIKILGVSILIWLFFLIAILTWFLLKHTVMGREILAIGGNKESALRVGINFNKVQIFVFAYMGFLAGIAAIAQISYTKAVDPNGLSGLELSVIAAVVLGGTNIMGGRGTVIGTILGVLLLGIIQNGLILARIDIFWQKVVVGLIILLAVSYDHIQYKRAQAQLSRIEIDS